MFYLWENKCWCNYNWQHIEFVVNRTTRIVIFTSWFCLIYSFTNTNLLNYDFHAGRIKTWHGNLVVDMRNSFDKIIFMSPCRLSVSNDLRVDAERDLRDIGASKIEVHPLNKVRNRFDSHVATHGSLFSQVVWQNTRVCKKNHLGITTLQN